MVLTLPDTIGHELGIIGGIAIWTSLANILIQWFDFPGSIPFNLVFNFAAVTSTGTDLANHSKDFNWTRQILRVLTDLFVISVGLISYQLLFSIIGIDYRVYTDHSDLLQAINKRSKDSILTGGIIGILYYISHFTMFGSYRLAWNLVCLPFLHVYAVTMLYLWPD